MTNCANHDVLRILMLLSHGDWLSFTELQNKTNIDQDRLATILILGTKIYHVFAPSLYNYNHEWSVSKQRRPKDVQDLIYASLNSEDCSIEDVEYYNLAGCVSTDFISDAIYRKLNAQRCKKKTRKKQKSQ